MARQIIIISNDADDTGNLRSVSELIVSEDGREIGRFATMDAYTQWREQHEPDALAAEREASARHNAEVAAREAEYKAHCEAQRAANAARNARNPFGPR